MGRRQLFEVLDQARCPLAVRDGVTDCLEAITGATDAYRTVRERILAGIVKSGATRVVDLCSGGGGPWLSRPWSSRLPGALDIDVFLTDKFPSRTLRGRLSETPHVHAIDFSVDATNVPAELRGFRTIFSSFHHFPDELAGMILRDAVRARDGLASAEVTCRSRRAFLTMFLMPFFVWALTPRIRPLRWSRLLLTYLLPAIPLVILVDGLISCLRGRTPEELLALTKPFPEYEWEAGYARGSWLAPVYLIGPPRETA